MTTIAPFRDDAGVLSLGAFTIENGTDRVALYGSLDLTKDKAGLAQARALKTVLDAIVDTLAAEASLPDKIEAPRDPGRVKNPFA